MPYTSHNWINGDSANTTKLNNLETQYTEATLSFGPDVFTAGFVLTGFTAAKDGSVANQLDVAAGTAYLLQADGTTRQRKTTTQTTQTTAALSSTYHLYLQPDGTWYWNTANSPAANSLAICNVTTDGSGNIATVTDARSLTPTLLPNAVGVPTFPAGVAATAPSSFDAGLVATDGLGALSLKPPTTPAAPSAAAASSGASSITYRSTILGESGLLRYYRLDESSGTSAADLKSSQSGTYTGGFTLSQVGALNGDNDAAILLNGTTGYVSLPTTSLPTGNGAWSIEAWVILPNSSNAFTCIAGFGTNGSHTEASIRANGAGLYADTGSAGTTVQSISTGVWHHIVGTWDGTTLKLYVDGALAQSATPGVASIGSTGANIGRDTDNTHFFNGYVDEVAIYNVTLSAAQVTSHYNYAVNGPDYTTKPGVGAYQYTVTYATASSETAQSPVANVTTTATNQKVNLSSIPTGPKGTTKRNLYRTARAGSALLFLAAISDNTSTTYSDTAADSSLGAAQNSPPAGGIAKVGGQATAGNFGVAPIVSVAKDVAVSVNTQVTISTFTVPNDGVNHIVRLNAEFWIGSGNTNNGTITLWAGITDPVIGATNAGFYSLGSATPLINATTVKGNPYATTPMVLEVSPNTTVTVKYTNAAAGTISDKVTAIIELLA